MRRSRAVVDQYLQGPDEMAMVTEQQVDRATNRTKVKIRWAKGGELMAGEFDEALGYVYAKRGKYAVVVSIHSGEIAWVSPV